MTNFFEPINISATHIYHSALELCPTSSIVRQLYYDRCHGITRFPRVVTGTQDSWDAITIFAGKNDYHSCTWSPCGQFVAAKTEKAVEIRNQHTFELFIKLRPTTFSPHFSGTPTYSPDGRSLACRFDDVIFIWDIQTGGVVREIRSYVGKGALVWSLDGRAIFVTTLAHQSRTGLCLWVETYEVASGVKLFGKDFQVESNLHFWAYEESFRFAEYSYKEDRTVEITISGIGPQGAVEVESLSVRLGTEINIPREITFFPSTRLLSVTGQDSPLIVLDTRDSRCLLHEESYGQASCQISSDGSFFAASHREGVKIWKYTSGSYVSWIKWQISHYQYPGPIYHHLSPTSPSIMSWFQNLLRLRSLDNPPATPKPRVQHAAISRSGRHIASAYKSETTVTIVDLPSQTSQFVDTDVEIEGLAITGNVLLVASSEAVVAWSLPEEVMADRRIGHGDSVWTMSNPLLLPEVLGFMVEDQVGVVGIDGIFPLTYHTETGDVLGRTLKPQTFSSRWVSFYKPIGYREYQRLRNRNHPTHDARPGDRWLILPATMEDAGWVRDPEGKHRFWVPATWRKCLGQDGWHDDITTLFTMIYDQPLIIKF